MIDSLLMTSRMLVTHHTVCQYHHANQQLLSITVIAVLHHAYSKCVYKWDVSY